MEVVLPVGKILKTGASSLVGMEKPLFWPFGGGPDLSRVFTASRGTLGIVTKATIKVKQIPQSRKLLFIPFDKLGEVIDPLYKIQRSEIGKECLLANNFNLSVMLSENPSKREVLRKALPQWILLLCLTGPEEKIKYQEEDLKDLGVASLYALSTVEKSVEEFLDEFSCPQRISRLLGYKAICRKISFYTTLDRVPEFNLNVHNIIRTYEYSEHELGAFITPVEQGHACFVEYYIFADPTKSSDVDRVEKLYIELYEQLANLGGNIDRPCGRVAGIVYSKNPMFRSFLKTVKAQLDPNNIMNPGRLF